MHTGETERLPANVQILVGSIVFTIISFAVFRGMWHIKIPFLALFAILILQISTVLLGNRGILTSMGAASIAIFLSLAAYFVSVVLLFPSVGIIRLAGITCGAAAAFLILASSITSFRAGSLDIEILDAIKLETVEGEDIEEIDEKEEPAPHVISVEDDDIDNAFDEVVLQDPIDLSEGTESLKTANAQVCAERTEGKQADDIPVGSDQSPGQGRDSAGREIDKVNEPGDTEMARESDGPDQQRCRYRIIEAATGKTLGTYYSDEGHSSLDPVTLGDLLGEDTRSGELRIVNLDWTSFDEMEVQVKRVPRPADGADGQSAHAHDPGEGQDVSQNEDTPDAAFQEKETTAGLPEGVTELGNAPLREQGPERYVIYDRRTMRPMGEYTPKGEKPRIDRLTLYRLFPEYDFRTFQIDSIRWMGGELGIFIKGERKKE